MVVRYLIILLAYFFTLALVADMSSVSYSPVQTAQQREANPIYEEFPGFEDIELVRSGLVDVEWNRFLNLQMWPSGYAQEIGLEDFENLKVSDFDIIPENIILEENRAVIPFSLSIRYKRKELLGLFEQGTINADGIIEIVISHRDEFIVKMIRFDDSNDNERTGRQIGAVSHYDGEFVSMVSAPALTRFFMEKTNQFRLVELIETHLSQD